MDKHEKYSVRPAEQDDASAIARLILDYDRAHESKFDDESVIKQTAELLSTCLAGGSHTAYVAFNPTGVGGYIVIHWIPFMWIQGAEGYVTELLVGEETRGSGVGQQLMAEVEGEARERGCVRLILNNLKSHNSYKRAFYAKLGFTEREHAANFVKPLSRP